MDPKELKSILRAVLISNPLKITVRGLQTEFRNNEGFEFPYKDMGFRNFSEYLYSIPDILKVIGSGQHAEVRVVLDKKSAHVAAMVSKQKTINKRRPYGHPMQFRERARFIPMSPNNIVQPNLPPKAINEININHKYDNIDISEKEGKKKNTNLKETPKSNDVHRDQNSEMPTVIKNENVFNSESAPHCSSDISIGNNLQMTENKYYGKDAVFKENLDKFYSSDETVINSDSMEKQPLNNENNIHLNENKLINNGNNFHSSDDNKLTNNESVFHSSELTTNVSDIIMKDNLSNNKFYSNENESIERHSNYDTDGFCSTETSFSDTAKKMPSMKVNRHCSSDSSDDDGSIVVTNKALKSDQGKFRKVSDGHEKNTCVSNRRKMLAEKSAAINYKVPLVVQNNLNELMHKFPDGLICSKLISEYHKLFKKTFKYQDYGYKTLIQMCCDLPRIIKFEYPESGDYKLFHVDFNIPKCAEGKRQNVLINDVEDYDINKPAIPRNFMEIFKDKLVLPEDVFQPNEKISVQTVKSGIDDYIDVQITEIYDPSKFWFNLRTHVDKLNDLMDEMRDFYKEGHKNYTISRCQLREGLYCVALYMQEYHRAYVTKITNLTDPNVIVFFIDYGTVFKVPKDELCFLHVDFSKMPAQALRGRLARIHPPLKDDMWSVQSTQYFLSLVRNKQCIAQIIARDDEMNIFELVLADTSGEEDIFINDSLVFAGHARFQYQGWLDTFNYQGCLPVVENVHLYPTFDEIECASVPSLNELLIIAECTSISVVFPQYFKKKSDAETLKTSFGKTKTMDFECAILENTQKHQQVLENTQNDQQEHCEEEIESYATAGNSPEPAQEFELDRLDIFKSAPMSFIVRKSDIPSEAETMKTTLRKPPGLHSTPSVDNYNHLISLTTNSQNLISNMQNENTGFNISSSSNNLQNFSGSNNSFFNEKLNMLQKILNIQGFDSNFYSNPNMQTLNGNNNLINPISNQHFNNSSFNQPMLNQTAYLQNQRCDSELSDITTSTQNLQLGSPPIDNLTSNRVSPPFSNIISNRPPPQLGSPLFNDISTTICPSPPSQLNRSSQIDSPQFNNFTSNVHNSTMYNNQYLNSESRHSNFTSNRSTPLPTMSSSSQSLYSCSPQNGVAMSPPPFTPPVPVQQHINYNYPAVRYVPYNCQQQMQPMPPHMFYNGYPPLPFVYPKQQPPWPPVVAVPNKQPQAYSHSRKINKKDYTQNVKDTTEVVETEKVDSTPNKRRFTVKADIFGLSLHVILFNEEPHLLISEVHRHYPEKSLLMLKRALCMEKSISIVDVNLKIHKELRNELIKTNAVVENKDIVDILPLRHIADVVKCLGDKTISMESLEPVLREYNRDSQVWCNVH